MWLSVALCGSLWHFLSQREPERIFVALSGSLLLSVALSLSLAHSGFVHVHVIPSKAKQRRLCESSRSDNSQSELHYFQFNCRGFF